MQQPYNVFYVDKSLGLFLPDINSHIVQQVSLVYVNVLYTRYSFLQNQLPDITVNKKQTPCLFSKLWPMLTPLVSQYFGCCYKNIEKLKTGTNICYHKHTIWIWQPSFRALTSKNKEGISIIQSVQNMSYTFLAPLAILSSCVNKSTLCWLSRYETQKMTSLSLRVFPINDSSIRPSRPSVSSESSWKGIKYLETGHSFSNDPSHISLQMSKE